MAENRVHPEPGNKNAAELNENRNVQGEQFESDTQRIIHRHLENKDDIITDDDIANVRVGATPAQFDDATEARFEDDANLRKETEDDLLQGTKEMKEDENLDEGQVTPWDMIDPNQS
jgi:hypothetical protein